MGQSLDHDADKSVSAYETVVPGVPATGAVVSQYHEEAWGNRLARYIVESRPSPRSGNLIARHRNDPFDEQLPPPVRDRL
jgi:hypothetical protein